MGETETGPGGAPSERAPPSEGSSWREAREHRARGALATTGRAPSLRSRARLLKLCIYTVVRGKEVVYCAQHTAVRDAEGRRALRTASLWFHHFRRGECPEFHVDRHERVAPTPRVLITTRRPPHAPADRCPSPGAHQAHRTLRRCRARTANGAASLRRRPATCAAY